MTSRLAIVLLTVPVLLLELPTGGVGDASAQIGPSQLPPPGSTGPSTKPDGVAEQADKDPEQLPTTPVLPPPRSRRKRFELLELDGYYRFRTDYFRNFHLGFDDRGLGGAPFARPLSCAAAEENTAASCGDSLKGANMRLRLEPTINISELSKVHMQIDVLDNVILGSTPAPGTLPISGDAPGQLPPEAIGDQIADSIRVKRAWAEVETSLGQVSFGRQPWHWGLGIFANAGGADPFSATYDLDSDYGDTVDRVMFRTQVPGTNLDAAVAMDWGAAGPTAAQTGLYATAPAVDLENTDDVSQWVLMLSRFDTPKIFAERLARGELAVNYGGLLIYRTQGWDTPLAEDGTPAAESMVARGLKTYTPDVWLRLGKGMLTFELEAVATIGSIDDVSDIDPEQTEGMDIRRFGGVARLGYRALEGALGLKLEIGHASGDQWDNTTPGATHVSNARPLPGSGDTTVNAFLFDPDYEVDMILFRELLGTVTNATYVKPSLSYQLTEQIAASFRTILSFANKPVATPGNGAVYGLELNGDIGYHGDNFFAGLAAGALFPMSAMHHPEDGEGGPGYGFQDPNDSALSNTGDAGNAYTIQSRLVLRF